MKPTRRELAAAAATLALRTEAQAQQPDLLTAIRDANRRNSDVLTKFDIPVATEPASRFEP